MPFVRITSLFIFISIPIFSQQNMVEIRVGNSIMGSVLKKGVTQDPDSYIHIFQIETTSDGIISRINLLTNNDLQDPIDLKLHRDGNEMTIERFKKQSIDIIKWTKNELQVVGPHFTRKSKTPMDVFINPRKDVVYESSEIILYSLPKGVLREDFKKTPSDFDTLRYENHVLFVDYRRANNVNYKYEFREQPNDISATYYYPAGDDFLKYSPAIEIRGKRFHSSDVQTNVLNYFILKAANALLADVLFPSLFAAE